MVAALIKPFKYEPRPTLCVCFLSLFGLMLLGIASVIFKGWYSAPEPWLQSFRPHITSQAEVIPALKFQPGLPQVEVSMFDFVNASAGKPYIVSFPSDWLQDPPSSWSDMGFVSYSLRVTTASGERYLYAKEPIPNYSETHPFGWRMKTVFDQSKNAFVATVVGTAYQDLFWDLILFVVGGIVFLLGGALFFDEVNRLRTWP